MINCDNNFCDEDEHDKHFCDDDEFDYNFYDDSEYDDNFCDDDEWHVCPGLTLFHAAQRVEGQR